MALTDFHAAAEQQLLNDTSPEIEAILRNPEAYPFLIVTKFSPDHEDLSPCITVYDEPRIPDIVDAVEGLNEALGYWRNVIPGASVQKEASSTFLIGASNAASARWNFEYTHRAGKTWKVESTTNIVLKGDQMQTFHFMRAEGSEQSVETDLLTCEKSVRYT